MKAAAVGLWPGKKTLDPISVLYEEQIRKDAERKTHYKNYIKRSIYRKGLDIENWKSVPGVSKVCKRTSYFRVH